MRNDFVVMLETTKEDVQKIIFSHNTGYGNTLNKLEEQNVNLNILYSSTKHLTVKTFMWSEENIFYETKKCF